MPVTDHYIQHQLQNISFFSKFFTGREIAHLPRVIRQGENIGGIVTGFHQEATWLIVVTDQRLIFLDKGMIAKLKVIEMPLSEIQSIAYETGFFSGTLTIRTGGGTMVIEKLWKEGTQYIAGALSQAMSNARGRRR